MGACDSKHADRRIDTHSRKSEFSIASDPSTGPTTHIQKPRPAWDPCQRERTPKSAKLQLVDELVEPKREQVDAIWARIPRHPPNRSLRLNSTSILSGSTIYKLPRCCTD